MSSTITITPGQLDLHLLQKIYSSKDNLQLDPACRNNVDLASQIVTAAAEGSAPVYGVNTGFGKLANTRIDAKDAATLQRNLILSHCCGVGEPLDVDIVRLIMALKINSLARGASGVRWQVIEQLVRMLEKGVIPVIPGQGSVGASGDLAPLAHLTAAMIGEARVQYEGEIISSQQGLAAAGLEPVILGPKEGLAMINGTQVSTALALGALFDTGELLHWALITGAMTSDAMMASTAPFRAEIQALRGHRGQIDSGNALRSLLVGSEIRESHRENDARVQDPYCMRCQPQVMGACIDLLRNAAQTLVIESNAVTDNPLVIVDQGVILSGGNFHAEPVAFAADQIALAVAEIGSITERRIASLVDPVMSYGLPAFLSPAPGLNSGFMIAEVTAAALMAENKQRAMPCSVDSTPTSANQEDHVSMACHAARRLADMNRNLCSIIGIELLVSAQGIGFRQPLRTSEKLQSIISQLRQHVPKLEDDRYMSDDLESARQFIVRGEGLCDVRADLPKLY